MSVNTVLIDYYIDVLFCYDLLYTKHRLPLARCVVRADGSCVTSDFVIQHPNHMNDAAAVLTDKYNAVLVLLQFYVCTIIYSTNFEPKETTL